MRNDGPQCGASAVWRGNTRTRIARLLTSEMQVNAVGTQINLAGPQLTVLSAVCNVTASATITDEARNVG